jgi:hypothetical protein
MLVQATTSLYGHSLLVVIFNGLSVGSFLFVSCIEMVPAEFVLIDRFTAWRFLSLFIGFSLMAVMALLE